MNWKEIPSWFLVWSMLLLTLWSGILGYKIWRADSVKIGHMELLKQKLDAKAEELKEIATDVEDSAEMTGEVIVELMHKLEPKSPHRPHPVPGLKKKIRKYKKDLNNIMQQQTILKEW